MKSEYCEDVEQNVVYCHQRTKKFVKFGHVVKIVVYKICEWTDRRTDTLIAILCAPTGSEVIRTNKPPIANDKNI